MNARSIRVFRLVAMSLLLVAVTGACMQMDVQSEFAEDGGATHSLRFTISKEALQAMGVSEQDLEQQLQPQGTPPPGVTIEQINTEQEAGFLMRTEVDNATDLGTQLNQLLSSGDEGAPTKSFSGSFRRDGNTYTLDLTFDADAFFNSAGQAAGEQVPTEMMSQMLTVTYTARLPGEVEEHNGTLLEDGRIQWTLPYSGTMRITARSETPGAFGGLLVPIVAAAAIGAVLLIGVGIVMLTRRRPQPAVATTQPEGMTESEVPPAPPGGATE